MHKFILASAALALAACTAAEVQEAAKIAEDLDDVEVVRNVIGPAFAATIGVNAVTAEVDDATGSVKILIDGVERLGLKADTQDMSLLGGLKLVSDVGAAPDPTSMPVIPSRQIYAFYAKSDHSVVASAAETLDVTGVQKSGQFYARLGSTTLPMDGTATFTGGYAGTLGLTTRSGVEIGAIAVITGKAVLDVDFANASIGGSISDRVYYGLGHSSAAPNVPEDIILQSTPIDSMGKFSGKTLGGKPHLNYDPAIVGEFEGALTGPNAEEVVGRVEINHLLNLGPNPDPERGVFIAKQ